MRRKSDRTTTTIQKKIACKTFVDSKGDSIVLSNGFFHLKSVICEFEKNIDSFAYLASNNSTYYDIDQDTKNVMLEYSPLTLLRIQQRKNELIQPQFVSEINGLTTNEDNDLDYEEYYYKLYKDSTCDKDPML